MTKPLPQQGLGSEPQLLLSCGAGAGHFGVLAAEALNPASRIHQLLLARKEWMAGRADFYVDVAAMRGAGGDYVAAGAVNAHFVVCGMNASLHGKPFC